MWLGCSPFSHLSYAYISIYLSYFMEQHFSSLSFLQMNERTRWKPEKCGKKNRRRRATLENELNSVNVCLLARCAYTRREQIVSSVWGKMSRYLNYGKSFIIAIITNANFRHFVCFFSSFLILLLDASQCLRFFAKSFFTILSMYLVLDFSSPAYVNSQFMCTLMFSILFFSIQMLHDISHVLSFLRLFFIPQLCFIFILLTSSFRLLDVISILHCNLFSFLSLLYAQFSRKHLKFI